MAQRRLSKEWKNGSLWEMTNCSQVVTFIGAGGKTTCLQSLTREIADRGQRVVATTTTKVFPEEGMKSWQSLSPPPWADSIACFWYVDFLEENGKWIGPSLQAVDEAILSDTRLGKRFWVIEGDGAKRLKLKCWAPHEPQIPRRSDCVVLVVDGGLWGKPLQAEQVHRPEFCWDLLGHVWDAAHAWRYFLRSPVFASQYTHMAWVILLNMKVSADVEEPLPDLRRRWSEIEQEGNDLKYRPNHLRIAAGNAKEGKLQWCDLW